MEQLFLVRHGETDWNAERRLQGQADRPLSIQGRRQAVALGRYLRSTHFDSIFCSDLKRAFDTAVLAGFADAHASYLWREFDVGRWRGRIVEDLVAKEGNAYLRWRSGDRAPPEGESWSAFDSRIRDGLTALEAVAGKVLLVTHSGVIRAIMKMVLGLPPGTLAAVGHASVSVLNFGIERKIVCYDFRPAG